MAPEEICALLNEHKHDGESDWAFSFKHKCYVSEAQARKRPTVLFMSLSPKSAEIIAGYYSGRDLVKAERARCAAIVREAREGERDGDLRSIIYAIERGPK